MHHLALQYIDRCSYLHIPGTTTGLDLCSLFQPNALEGPVPNLITKCRECPNKAVHKLHTSPATTTATGPNLCILSNQMLVHDLSHVWQPNVGNVQMLPCVSQFGINSLCTWQMKKFFLPTKWFLPCSASATREKSSGSFWFCDASSCFAVHRQMLISSHPRNNNRTRPLQPFPTKCSWRPCPKSHNQM